MKRISNWFQNLSLNRKLIILVLAVGIIPLVLTFWLSLRELQNNSRDRQIYTVNQGYNQVFQSLQERMRHVHSLSTLISINESINKTLKPENVKADIYDQLSYFENISTYLYSLELSFDLDDILLYVDDDFYITNRENGRILPIHSIKELQWYQQLQINNGRPTWVSFQDKIGSYDEKYIALTRMIRNKQNFMEPLGVLAVLMEKKSIKNMLIPSEVNQAVYLESSDGSILASNIDEDSYVTVPIKERRTADKSFHQITLDGKQYLMRSSLIEGTDVYLVSIIPEDIMAQTIREMTSKIAILYILVTCFLLLMMYPLTLSITSRIRLLRNQMSQVKTGEIHKLEIETHTDEVGQLISSYNNMVQKVDELMVQQFAMGQEKTEAELKALQSQINPHFLYNTLDMINWMSQKKETENITEVIQAMSMFYRLSLSRGRDIISIREEVKMCEAYMEIQRRRFRGRIRFEEDLQDEIMEYLIPKITLQPFIENAIIHGINEKEDGRGVVLLTGWIEDDRIYLSVTDDGKGMSEEDKGNSGGSHYGMSNIEKRLSLFYGEEIVIQVESSFGVGTCISINIPPIKELKI